MPEVKETVFAIVEVGANESHSMEWDPETTEAIQIKLPDGKMRTTVQPKRESKD